MAVVRQGSWSEHSEDAVVDKWSRQERKRWVRVQAHLIH